MILFSEPGRWFPGRAGSVQPANRGTKQLPVGRPGCLAIKSFVLTGVLDSLLREEAVDLIKTYGGY